MSPNLNSVLLSGANCLVEAGPVLMVGWLVVAMTNPSGPKAAEQPMPAPTIDFEKTSGFGL